MASRGRWTSASHRVAVVHQEPQLFPNLTVGDNVMVGREGTRWLRRGLDDARSSRSWRDLGIMTSGTGRSRIVPLAIQQRTEIARALVQQARVFLFDEPNSALTEEESNDLFRRMHALADAGTDRHPCQPPARRARASMRTGWWSSSTARQP